MNHLHAKDARDQGPAGLAELERAASALHGDGAGDGEAALETFRTAQRNLWLGLRRQGNPWLITDFISLGSPMYFADRIYTKNRKEFDQRVRRSEFPTCPPQPELADYNNINHNRLWYSYKNGSVRSLHHAAPFAVVRWTNLWFPAGLGFFGDWFGGPLAPLFGPGIKDLAVKGNRPRRWFPALAHAQYFKLSQVDPASVRYLLRDAMDLASSGWLEAEAKPDLTHTDDAQGGPAYAEHG
jgi:hypothetical protein